eukprot:761467-Hanusia_phi.AAC.1
MGDVGINKLDIELPYLCCALHLYRALKWREEPKDSPRGLPRLACFLQNTQFEIEEGHQTSSAVAEGNRQEKQAAASSQGQHRHTQSGRASPPGDDPSHGGTPTLKLLIKCIITQPRKVREARRGADN